MSSGILDERDILLLDKQMRLIAHPHAGERIAITIEYVQPAPIDDIARLNLHFDEYAGLAHFGAVLGVFLAIRTRTNGNDLSPNWASFSYCVDLGAFVPVQGFDQYPVLKRSDRLSGRIDSVDRVLFNSYAIAHFLRLRSVSISIGLRL